MLCKTSVTLDTFFMTASLRIWFGAAGGPAPFLPGDPRGAAEPRPDPAVLAAHRRVPENCAGFPDSPARPDRPQRVHGEPRPLQNLHPPARPVAVRRSGNTGQSVRRAAAFTGVNPRALKP